MIDSTSSYKGSNEGAQDTSVRQLENLKHSLGKTLEIMKSQSAQYEDINGKQKAHSILNSKAKEDGKLLARIGQNVYSETTGPDGKATTKVRTDVDIPSKGIHKSVVQQLPDDEQDRTGNAQRRSPVSNRISTDFQNAVSKLDISNGVQYSPLDMAEYIFWTGDEKGVSLSIEEFLQDGLMSREEAISFLQEIKYNLEYLKSHYNQLGSSSRDHSKNSDGEEKQNNELERSSALYDKPELQTSFDINQLRQEAAKKRTSEPVMTKTAPIKLTRQEPDQDKTTEEEAMERLRMADFLYTQYSLEEVIYQLSKIMFVQGLTNGNLQSQRSLQKFTNFLEQEAEKGHISRNLEKKVLDILIASLSDTLIEQPEILNASQQGNDAAIHQNFIYKLLGINPDQESLKNAKIGNHASLGIPYKNQ
ncbi:unnamed protein product [Brassicogethes aeneus]|uniref:Uncharacterized protein n=1 Tax=Brassicogethes aeneus TaxID=1431903 RepID=A0A9P0BB34_BRAAE|nr:unnamed protein product [Brassicogethes aeneus]